MGLPLGHANFEIGTLVRRRSNRPLNRILYRQPSRDFGDRIWRGKERAAGVRDVRRALTCGYALRTAPADRR